MAQVFGTGWRKNREEASKPKMWDGENGGGKALMKLREEFKKNHQFDAGEEKETERRFIDLKRSTWRRNPNRDEFDPSGNRRGFGRGSFGGGYGGGYGGRGRGFGGGTFAFHSVLSFNQR